LFGRASRRKLNVSISVIKVRRRTRFSITEIENVNALGAAPLLRCVRRGVRLLLGERGEES
jgi:hypothetical protein